MHETFEHKADIGIRGKGKTVKEAFTEAAKAMFSVQANIKKIKASKKIKISCKAENKEELFIEWLNALLSQSSLKNMLFSKFKITRLDKNKLQGFAFGEKIKKEHQLRTEVKAATYSGLKIYKKKSWIVECVVDV
ncbi:MAG: archease [archaeon]|nr:MAG: archease [archaeon]